MQAHCYRNGDSMFQLELSGTTSIVILMPITKNYLSNYYQKERLEKTGVYHSHKQCVKTIWRYGAFCEICADMLSRNNDGTE